MDAVPNNLPVQLSTFVGRLEEIATVAALVQGNRLVTIMGTGGAGKTRLSQQVAAEVSDLFVDGTWWVELVAATDGDAVPLAVAAAIGARLPGGTAPVDALVSNIGDRRMLLVLDSCEHVVVDAAVLTHALLRGCRNLTVVNEFVGRAQLALLVAEYDKVIAHVDVVHSVLSRLGIAYDVMMTPIAEVMAMAAAPERGGVLDDAAISELRRRLHDAQTNGQHFGAIAYAVCLGAVAHGHGDAAEARRCVDIAKAIGPWGLQAIEVGGLLTSVALHHCAGDLIAALGDVERGRAACAQLGTDVSVAMFEVRAGHTALAKNDHGTAESLIHGALRVVSERGFRREVALVLEALVIVEAAGEHWLDAARLHGAAERLRNELGFRLRLSPERESYAAALDTVRRSLGDEADTAIAEGSALT